MKIVGAFEAKSKLSQLLVEVEHGEKIMITKHGKPIALLMPYVQKDSTQESIDSIKKCREKVTLGPDLTIKQLINEGRK